MQKQILSQKIQEFERLQVYKEYKERIGEIVIGEIRQIRRDSIVINIDRAELKIAS